ncbi:MAG: Crp/Fnr family transcriptional regulator [Verrucomicrobiota bacterium]|jgi:CRP-like cAMP-binding protein
MNPPLVIDSPPGPAAPVADATDSSEALAHSLYALIKQQPFFNGLNTQQLQLLAASALEMKFEAGATIFQEGSPANRFYLILKGRVVLSSEMEDRNVIPIQTLGAGDDLGWSWLFPPYSMHFSACALEPTTAIFFYGTRLREQCEQDHELGYQIMKRIAEVATQSLRATQRRLMQYIDKNTYEKQPEEK